MKRESSWTKIWYLQGYLYEEKSNHSWIMAPYPSDLAYMPSWERTGLKEETSSTVVAWSTKQTHNHPNLSTGTASEIHASQEF